MLRCLPLSEVWLRDYGRGKRLLVVPSLEEREGVVLGLVDEDGFLRKDLDTIRRNLVWSRLHIDRSLSHLLHLEDPVVGLANLCVREDDHTVSQILLQLDSTLYCTHSPQFGSHEASRTTPTKRIQEIED